MRPAITIALYDLLRSLKARDTFLVGLLMPAAMMLLLGLAMGGGGEETITIDVLDEDGSALSQQFVDVLKREMQEGGSFRLCPYHAPPDDCDLDSGLDSAPLETWRTTADSRLEDTDTYGAIIIPAEFGEALRAGDSVTVQFKSSGELSAPTLAEHKIDAAIGRMNGAVSIANLAVDIAVFNLDAITPGSTARADAFDTVRAEVEAAWDTRPIRIESTSTKEQINREGFNQSGPGIAVMFVLIFMLNSATLLVSERETGTLQRLYTLPVRKSVVLAGKLLGQYLYGLALFAVLIAVGTLMSVEWGDNVLGIVLIVLAFTLAATALGLALATVVRTSAQAQNVSLLMGLTLAPLGGAWWPMEIVPDFMKTFGHLSPIAWAMDAFQEMMFYDGGVIDILPMLGVLLGMAALFFAFGVFNFEYE